MKTRRNEAMYGLYLKAFHRTAHAYADNPEQDPALYIKKLIYYGVRMVNTRSEPEYITYERSNHDFQFAETIQALIGTLTPGEFVTLFPIAKEFDGHRYQTKDYFYTRDYLRALQADKPISDSVPVIEFLWAYHNWEISRYVVNVFGYIDNLRRLEGQPSMMEEFCAKHGIKSYTMYTDTRGKKFVVDRESGKSFRVKERRPRHLKTVNQSGRR